MGCLVVQSPFLVPHLEGRHNEGETFALLNEECQGPLSTEVKYYSSYVGRKYHLAVLGIVDIATQLIIWWLISKVFEPHYVK
jgi:hypothetical protein